MKARIKDNYSDMNLADFIDGDVGKLTRAFRDRFKNMNEGIVKYNGIVKDNKSSNKKKGK